MFTVTLLLLLALAVLIPIDQLNNMSTMAQLSWHYHPHHHWKTSPVTISTTHGNDPDHSKTSIATTSTHDDRHHNSTATSTTATTANIITSDPRNCDPLEVELCFLRPAIDNRIPNNDKEAKETCNNMISSQDCLAHWIIECEHDHLQSQTYRQLLRTLEQHVKTICGTQTKRTGFIKSLNCFHKSQIVNRDRPSSNKLAYLIDCQTRYVALMDIVYDDLKTNSDDNSHKINNDYNESSTLDAICCAALGVRDCGTSLISSSSSSNNSSDPNGCSTTSIQDIDDFVKVLFGSPFKYKCPQESTFKSYCADRLEKSLYEKFVKILDTNVDAPKTQHVTAIVDLLKIFSIMIHNADKHTNTTTQQSATPTTPTPLTPRSSTLTPSTPTSLSPTPQLRPY